MKYSIKHETYAGKNPPKGWTDVGYSSPLRKLKPMTEPTPIDLASPEFNAIWDVVKKWDLERTPGDGYHHGTGTDVMEILNSLRKVTYDK